VGTSHNGGIQMRGRASSTSVLLINGDPVRGCGKPMTLLASLSNHFGQVMPYDKLFAVLGYETTSQKRRQHLLRQHVSAVKKLLADHRVGCAVTVAHECGYALCEVVQAQRLRRDDVLVAPDIAPHE
jgi:hypothetical protein